MKFRKPKFWDGVNFLSISLLPFSLVTLIYNNLKSNFITRYKYKSSFDDNLEETILWYKKKLDD